MFSFCLPLLAVDIAEDMARDLQTKKECVGREHGYEPAEFSNATRGRRAWDVNRILQNVTIAEAFHRALGRALAKHHAMQAGSSAEDLLDQIAMLLQLVKPVMAKAELRASAKKESAA